MPFSPPFFDFVKRIPPTLMSHVASSTFSVVAFLSEFPAFFSGSFWVHPAITRLAMIAINIDLIIIKLQFPCDLFAVAKLDRTKDVHNTDF